MKKVGITGGIGSGKSTVCEIFKTLNIPVYQADDRAKFLMQNDSDLVSKIKTTFGDESFVDGQLNRTYLAKEVFGHQDQTTKINAIVHPAVGRDFEAWVEKQNSAYVIKEAALMIESGSYKHLDFLINVSAPLNVRISRVLKRDPQRSPEEINGIIEKQVKEDQREELADITIYNNGQSLLIPQVLKIHQKLTH